MEITVLANYYREITVLANYYREITVFTNHYRQITVLVVVVFTLTDRASTIPSSIRGCQSGTWSQRGTKVNGSHHGDNPLLRPTGIQIATKSYATLQAMAPTNNKTVNQTSFTPFREQPRSTRIVVAYPRTNYNKEITVFTNYYIERAYCTYELL